MKNKTKYTISHVPVAGGEASPFGPLSQDAAETLFRQRCAKLEAQGFVLVEEAPGKAVHRLNVFGIFVTVTTTLAAATTTQIEPEVKP